MSAPYDAAVSRPGSWWSRRSLRARLTAASMLAVAIGMTAAAALLVLRLHSSLLANLDDSITQELQDVAGTISQGQRSNILSTSTDGTVVVQVVAPDGHVVASSANAAGETRRFTFAAPGRGPVLRDVTGVPFGDEGTYRVAGMSAVSPSGPVTVYAGRPIAEITQSVDELILSLAVGVPIIVLLLGLVAWQLVGRALRPVEAMRRQASAIPGTDLHQRLEAPTTDDELHRLASTFNELLTRIESSTSRQRQFVADAAHELRSPVAALRAQLDVNAHHPQLTLTPADRDELAGDATRLTRLVDDLLALARLDAHPRLRRAPVDLDDLVLDEMRRVQGRSSHRIDSHGVSGGRVLGDADALDRVVKNLLDNAIRHARDTVTVRLRTDHTTVTLTVADDGSGIPAADRDRIFDRFIRLEDARTRDAGGSGLGLAIVRDVVAAHRGNIAVEDNHPGTRMVITLPIEH